MFYPEFHYRWEWQLRSDPLRLWPLVTDTNRFNRDTGVPALRRDRLPTATGSNARRELRLYRFGIPVEWEEEPFEWVQPYRFGVMRRYRSGPLREMRVFTELIALPEGGTHLIYEVWARPSNPLGLIAIPAQIGFLSARSFAAAFQRYDTLVAAGGDRLDLPAAAPPQWAPGGRARLNALRQTLLDTGADPQIVARLAETLETADDLALSRLRPYALADRWDLPRRQVLETCLQATRAGLLEFQWDILCPLCRGTQEVSHTLSDIHTHVHCNTCNVDFDVNFERSVELTFRPNPAIREVEAVEYCMAGPQTTPHIAVQQLIAPGEERLVEPVLEPGRYRLRTLALRGGEFLRVALDGLREVTLRASAFDGWPEGELALAPAPALRLKNATDAEQLFIVERTAWSDEAVTAAEVTVLQIFRDLFANEALRPGEQISVGSLTILFTDLRGSTRLYNEIGDAPAFGLVMSHFDVLRDAISAEGGAIVKTIGDAVMAVFRRPAPALRAMLQAQRALAQAPGVGRPLHLRAGLHYGPCIAVRLNDRLDYFGSSVNVAARLEGQSSGDDVVISDVVRQDPEVCDLLDDPNRGFRAERFQAALKGFADSPFDLWRVSLSSAPAAEPPRSPTQRASV